MSRVDINARIYDTERVLGSRHEFVRCQPLDGILGHKLDEIISTVCQEMSRGSVPRTYAGLCAEMDLMVSAPK